MIRKAKAIWHGTGRDSIGNIFHDDFDNSWRARVYSVS